MAKPDSTLAVVARDARWLPHRFDPGNDAIQFRWTPRDEHARVTFLTDDYLPPSDPVILYRREVVAAAPGPAPVHFIFHSAYCCSTLLARAFDIEGVAMGLKEPVILNDVVGWRYRGAEGRQVAEVLDHALSLLGRAMQPGEANVIKPSNIVNGLAPAMLSLRPRSKALLLHAPLEAYLGSIARKGMWGRLWARDLFVKLLKEGSIDLGFQPEDHLQHTDLQIAAVGWLAQQKQFDKLARTLGPDRIRTLDSEALVASPVAAMAALVAHFGISLAPERIEAVANGPAFTRHSKSDDAFGREQRIADQQDGARVHADEIEKVSVWAAAVAEGAGVPMTLPLPLI